MLPLCCRDCWNTLVDCERGNPRYLLGFDYTGENMNGTGWERFETVTRFLLFKWFCSDCYVS